MLAALSNDERALDAVERTAGASSIRDYFAMWRSDLEMRRELTAEAGALADDSIARANLRICQRSSSSARYGDPRSDAAFKRAKRRAYITVPG